MMKVVVDRVPNDLVFFFTFVFLSTVTLFNMSLDRNILFVLYLLKKIAINIPENNLHWKSPTKFCKLDLFY